jgi:hypothetical protein
MKRLVLFASIFGAGLLILVFALGPSRLWRRTPTSSIQPQDLPPAPDAISMSTQGQRMKIGMRGAGTIPFWAPVKQPDGSTLRVKQAQLKYTENEPHPGGVHLTSPILDLYPGKAADEKPVARVTAAGGDLETEGDLRSLAESLKQQQLKSFSLSPDVHLTWLGEDGKPALTVDTSQLDIPESPPAPEGDETERLLFPKLVAPNPVHVFAADGGFDLNAAGLELQRIDGRLELRGPITLNATHFALPAAAEPAAKAATRPKSDEPAANRPPITLTCDGHATFVKRPPDQPGQEGAAKAAARDAARAPAAAIGPGTLTFERNVVVRQSDPKTNDERSLRTDRLTLELKDENGQLTVTRLDAGGEGGPVTFGLLGGEGAARHLTRDGDDLTLTGPVHLDRMNVGRGSDARLFSLMAQEKLVMHEEAATDGGPPRYRAELFGAAHATAEGELDADGDHITALLRKTEEAAAPSGDSGSFDVDELVIDGKARLDMHARGKAGADKITLGGGGRGARKAHLEGDAVVTAPRGTLRAPTIDLTIPESRDVPAGPAGDVQPMRGSTPQMTDGRMALPAGSSLFGGSDAPPDPAKPQRPRELRLEPLAPTALEINGEELHLRGRTLVRLFELVTDEAPERETQRLTADSLDLLPASGAKGDAKGEPPQLVADGAVDVVDLERGFHLEAAHAHTELAADGDRHLLLDGAPAKGAIALPVPKGTKGETAELTLLSTHLDVDLQTHRIVADDRENLVTALVPESLVGTMLPSGFGVLEKRGGPAAELPPLEFHAEHVDVTPQEIRPAAKGLKLPPALAATATSDNPFMRSLVNARSRVHALRRSDGSTFDAETMVLDLAAARARLDGTAGAPVRLLRPKAYASDRVEQVITDWIEAVDGGAKVTMAARRDGPVMILFPEGEPEPGKVPKRLRVALQCSEPPVLAGDHLLLTGGVDTDLEIGGDHDPDGGAKAHSRSERVEVVLSGQLGEPNLALVRLNAQGRVHLDYDRSPATSVAAEAANAALRALDCHAEGARLTFDFKTGDLVLKEGVDPCRLLAADESGGWRSAATFRLMTGNLLELEEEHKRGGKSRANLLAAEMPRFRFEDFRLVAEGPRER